MESGYVPVSGSLCAQLAKCLIDPQVVGFECFICPGAKRAQDDPAICVEGDGEVNIGMAGDEIQHRLDLKF